MDREASESVTRTGDKDLQRAARDPGLRGRMRDLLGGAEVHRTSVDRKEEEIRHPAVGAVD